MWGLVTIMIAPGKVKCKKRKEVCKIVKLCLHNLTILRIISRGVDDLDDNHVRD